MFGKKESASTTVYPALDTNRDLWFMRIGGCGLGNCFYTYFHAVVLAEKFNATIIVPPWFSVKRGALLRSDAKKRFYWRMFKPFAGDIHGLRKLVTMLVRYRKRAIVEIDGSSEAALVKGTLNVVRSREWTFQGLHPYRDLIRQRLLSIMNDPVPPDHCWGQGEYIAVHVRLGDFLKLADPKLVLGAAHGTRLPIYWYVNVARALRMRYPKMPILVFSDGQAEELRPLLALGAQFYRSGSDMTDLLAMSGASILVGSNSTYSRWAAFLGNMPSIWLKDVRIAKEATGEPLPTPDIPILHVPIDATDVALWP
jgi:hypothetical protein